uniref:Uncharacterized protein n=1 Tax=Opuntia streptacantha TaxID=393608 RepID=A0A7C8ZBN3_OPUST
MTLSRILRRLSRVWLQMEALTSPLAFKLPCKCLMIGGSLKGVWVPSCSCPMVSKMMEVTLEMLRLAMCLCTHLDLVKTMMPRCSMALQTTVMEGHSQSRMLII